MAYENITVDRRGRVGVITLNRPKALNALNGALIGELNDVLDSFEAEEEIGAVVITGNEKAFAAGADINEMRRLSFAEAHGRDFIAHWHRITAFSKPVVAAVAGYALGGGCELAMMCDIVIAADNAKFGQPEIKLGTIPGAGGTQRLTRAVGKSKAMEMILTGRMMDAEEAERSGLASRVVPAADVVDEAIAVAERIAHFSGPHRRARQGERQPRFRDHARRGRPLRAGGLLRHLRDRGSEGRDGRLLRKARAVLHQPIKVAARAGGHRADGAVDAAARRGITPRDHRRAPTHGQFTPSPQTGPAEHAPRRGQPRPALAAPHLHPPGGGGDRERRQAPGGAGVARSPARDHAECLKGGGAPAYRVAPCLLARASRGRAAGELDRVSRRGRGSCAGPADPFISRAGSDASPRRGACADSGRTANRLARAVHFGSQKFAGNSTVRFFAGSSFRPVVSHRICL